MTNNKYYNAFLLVSLQNIGKGDIESQIGSGEKLPVAFHRENENQVNINRTYFVLRNNAEESTSFFLQIHLGEGVWIRFDTYQAIAKASKSPSMFVKNLAVAVFSPDTLRNSSVSGKISAKDKKAGKKARPVLEPTKVVAIKSKRI